MTTPAQRKLAELRLAEIRKAKTKRVRWFKWTGFAGKTLWDWLQLLGVLAIPLVVAGATIAFGLLQANLAQQQHDADQRQALDQQQATILQTYIDNIQDLLLNHNLLNAKPIDEVAIVARARTQTALQELDPERRGRLVQFIYEAQLIGFKDSNGISHPPIIDISGAILYGATLYGAHLRGAYLEGTQLEGARLDGATLDGATLISAHLTSADFRGATLRGTHFAEATLDGTDFRGATFDGADLMGASLSGADLRYATLYNTSLSDAKLNNAIITQQQLDQVKSCEGATLPDGFICYKTSS